MFFRPLFPNDKSSVLSLSCLILRCSARPTAVIHGDVPASTPAAPAFFLLRLLQQRQRQWRGSQRGEAIIGAAPAAASSCHRAGGAVGREP